MSDLDTAAADIFSAIGQAQLELQRGDSASWTRSFSGLQFERWFLKVAFGTWESGNFAANGERLPGKPPQLWGRLLLGLSAFPKPWGLYVEAPIAPFPMTHQEFEMIPRTIGPALKAVQFKLARVPFTLGMGKLTNSVLPVVYRPTEIVLKRGDVSKRISLRWPKGVGGGPIVYTWIGEDR